jgi:Flp pilus assembly protein TadG
VRELIWRRLHRDESGVTLVIVTLCLIALFGMLVLVVDVGGLLLNRREMVNASDAAALSAAKSCILPASRDPYALPEDAADAYALDNSPRAKANGFTNIVQISGCDTRNNGYVTVRYSADQHLFFAPVLGASNSGQVTTQATAIFGPSGRANPLPIVLYEQSFNTCKLNQQIDPTATCYVWEDNNNTGGDQSAFGLMDLRTDDPAHYGWDSVPGADCPNPGNDPDTWINNYQTSALPDLPVHWPAPTYVCRVDGFQQNAWADLEKLKDDDDSVDHNDQEDILYFPINRCDEVLPGNAGGQIAGSAQTWNEIACSGTPTQFDVIGYAAMKLIDIFDTLSAQGASGTCESDQTILQGAQDAVTFNVAALTPNAGKTCPTKVPDQFTSGPTMTKVANGGGSGPDPVKCPTVPANGCDYAYANGIITWSRGGPALEGQDFRISFGWQNAGECGIPPSNNNSAHCLVLLPVEVQIGGSCAGCGSPNSNLRSYRLCDPVIAGSCDPITVPVPPGS